LEVLFHPKDGMPAVWQPKIPVFPIANKNLGYKFKLESKAIISWLPE
jgi:hypothetical protein